METQKKQLDESQKLHNLIKENDNYSEEQCIKLFFEINGVEYQIPIPSPEIIEKMNDKDRLRILGLLRTIRKEAYVDSENNQLNISSSNLQLIAGNRQSITTGWKMIGREWVWSGINSGFKNRYTRLDIINLSMSEKDWEGILVVLACGLGSGTIIVIIQALAKEYLGKEVPWNFILVIFGAIFTTCLAVGLKQGKNPKDPDSISSNQIKVQLLTKLG